MGGVNPGVEIRVFAVRQPATAGFRLNPERFRGLFGDLKEKLRSFNDPRVVKPEMIGDEVQEQP